MKWVTRILQALALLVVLAMVLTATLRWFALDDEARDDVAMLMAPGPEASGDNGFAVLLLSNHEVPEARFDEVMAGEVARFEAFERVNREAMLAMARTSPQSSPMGLAYRLLEDGGFPAREPVPLNNAGCSLRGVGCLDKVRDDPEAIRALLATAGDRTGLATRALASGHIRSPYPRGFQAPLPPYQNLRLPLIAAALDGVEGRVPAAMSRACGVLADARRHAARADDLVQKAVMMLLGNGAAELLLDLRRASPDTPLPPSCAEALVPVQDGHYLLCEVLRDEFRMASRMARQIDEALAARRNPRDLFLRFTAIDAGVHDAWIAPRYADTCRDAYRAKLLAGEVPPTQGTTIGLSNPTCWGAVISCTLARATQLNVERYQAQALDSAATLRLQLAALAVLDGRLPRAQAAAASSSPGYGLPQATDEELAITLKAPVRKDQPRYTVRF
ncbi:hypothetical protein [Arenimonas metalli]|uniref:Uncharacterized protein n=1 Tax=Arenimonas metalli CF5-1 TaxID=1384056 RepID=A0A091BLD4_9GAMM|nr:hypothetical protein [Arenimonas metalli]KFN45140.1 hypothetical protein N787_03160 [Arenimonas metalli CF5-1]